jgi:hypothetical protein
MCCLCLDLNGSLLLQLQARGVLAFCCRLQLRLMVYGSAAAALQWVACHGWLVMGGLSWVPVDIVV